MRAGFRWGSGGGGAQVSCSPLRPLGEKMAEGQMRGEFRGEDG